MEKFILTRLRDLRLDCGLVGGKRRIDWQSIGDYWEESFGGD